MGVNGDVEAPPTQPPPQPYPQQYPPPPQPYPQQYPPPPVQAPPVHGYPQASGIPMYGHMQPQPYPGLPILPPRVPPQQGMIVIGYEVEQPTTGCCQCVGLNAAGWVVILLALIIFWPVAFVVCLIPEFFDRVQRPIYGFPPQPPPMAGPPPPK